MAELVRLSLSLEKPLLRRLQQLLKAGKYTNRSEFIRDLIRQRLVEQHWQRDQQVLATVTLVYDHHTRGLSAKLIDLQHHYHGAVMASTHVHLDERICAEVIILKGRAQKITELTELLRQQKGVLHAALSMSATGRSLQ